MTTKSTGGSAFPNITPDMNVDGCPGMTLRDWFAGKALQGMWASPRSILNNDNKEILTGEELAKMAYEQADDMIAERSK